MTSRLRAVKADEKAPPKTITEAAATGSQRDLLVALRDRIASTVEATDCPPRDLASLSKRLMELTKEIESIDAQAHQQAQRRGDVSDAAFDASAI